MLSLIMQMLIKNFIPVRCVRGVGASEQYGCA